MKEGVANLEEMSDVRQLSKSVNVEPGLVEEAQDALYGQLSQHTESF